MTKEQVTIDALQTALVEAHKTISMWKTKWERLNEDYMKVSSRLRLLSGPKASLALESSESTSDSTKDYLPYSMR
jgi:hypothetical protein